MNPLKKENLPLQFKAEASGSTLTMEIYDSIGADFFGQGITAATISDAIKNAAPHDNIAVRVNSPGGDAFEGVTIYNVLRNAAKPVNVYVDGLAASAASIICMAGDSITMGDGSMMMIHNAMGMVMGNADDLRQLADTLDTVSASIADIYVSRTKNSKTSVMDMMSAETWMSAKDAVKNGFATEVAGKSKVKNSFDLSSFKNVPVELKNVAKTKEVDGEHLTAGDFVYVGNADDTSTWSLPWHFSTDDKTKSHLRDALARFDHDEVIPESHKDEAYAKLLRLCKEHGIEVSRKGNPKNELDYTIALKRIEIERRK